MMSKAIAKMRGMNADLAKKLIKQGISNSDQLLALSRKPADRKKLAKDIDIDVKEVLALANRADLARITGIGAVFSDLLESAGVDTVKELAKRRSDNLHQTIGKVNEEKKLTSRIPTPAQVEGWVAQAKALPKMLEY